MSDIEKKEFDDNKKKILDDILKNMPSSFDEEEPESGGEESVSSGGEPIDAGTEETGDESEKTDVSESEEPEEPSELKPEEADVGDEEDDRPKKKKKRGGAGALVFGIAMTTMIVSAALLSATFILSISKELLGIDKSKDEIIIEIPHDSGTQAIADLLYNEGIITNVSLFRFFSRIRGGDGTYMSGIHAFTPNMSYGDLVEELQRNPDEENSERESVDVTFPEGMTLLAAASRLEENGVCNAQDFMSAFNSSEFGFYFEDNIENNALKFYRMEGYLFPDTYSFYIGEDPKMAARKIYKNFNDKITPDIYGRMEDMGLDLEELLTFASIVQSESARIGDMKAVAGIFWNRLNAPDEFPLLQSDPTTKYVTNVIKPNIEVDSEVIFKAYDTYQGVGLPPGPICNPGLDAINAVLYPSESEYYYFCNNLETGEFFFARTLEEHEDNLFLAGLV